MEDKPTAGETSDAAHAGKRRPRLIIDTKELTLRAIELEAIDMSHKQRREVGKSEVVNSILEKALAAKIEEARQERDGPDAKKRKGHKQ